jgi:hypothetical protein
MSDARFKLVVPPCTVRFFEVGEHCEDAKAGDFFLVHHGTLASDAIELGQEIEKAHDPIEGYTWSTHTAFARDKYTLSEMGFRGYERRDILDYKHKLYAVVHFDSSAAQVQASLDFDDACQGLEYGYQEYVGLMLEAIDRDVFAGSWGDAVVCSVHTTLVAMALGLFPDRWASLVYPALWAYWTGAKH